MRYNVYEPGTKSLDELWGELAAAYDNYAATPEDRSAHSPKCADDVLADQVVPALRALAAECRDRENNIAARLGL